MRKVIRNNFLAVSILTLVVWVSYGQVLRMYFLTDSYSTLYYAQQGLVLEFPYQFFAPITRVLLRVYGLEPRWYFLQGVILYGLAVFWVYWLNLVLLKRRLLAFGAALVMASGLIGQHSMIMFLGDGVLSTIGLNFILIMILGLVRFHEEGQKKWLWIALVCYWLVIIVSPVRYMAVVLVAMGIEFVYLVEGGFKLNIPLVLRTVYYIGAYLIEYLICPSCYFLGVSPAAGETEKFLEGLKVSGLIMGMVGSFGNLILPSFWTDELYFLDRIVWVAMIPALVLLGGVVIMVVYLKSGKVKKWRLGLIVAVMAAFTVLVVKMSGRMGLDVTDSLYVANGGVIVLMFGFLYLMRVPENKKAMWLSAVIVVSMLGTLCFVRPGRIFVSDHRYLFPAVFAPSMLVSFFISDKMSNRNVGKGRAAVAILLFVFPMLMMVGLRTIAARHLQADMVRDSVEIKRFFKSVMEELPSIEGKKALYYEGADGEMDGYIGKATRVGLLPSGASFAVHYGIGLENIVYISRLEEVPEILKANPDIGKNDVHAYIYSREGLDETSKLLWESLDKGFVQGDMGTMRFEVVPNDSVIESGETLVVGSYNFEYQGSTLGIYPKVVGNIEAKIGSMQPIEVKMLMKIDLPENLPTPYHQLYDKLDEVPKEQWPGILSWEFEQCEMGELTGAFECVDDVGEAEWLLKNERKGKMRVIWRYDTSGPIGVDNSALLSVDLDGKWHEHKFTIPAGGRYLEEIKIDYVSFPGELSLRELRLETAVDRNLFLGGL